MYLIYSIFISLFSEGLALLRFSWKMFLLGQKSRATQPPNQLFRLTRCLFMYNAWHRGGYQGRS